MGNLTYPIVPLDNGAQLAGMHQKVEGTHCGGYGNIFLVGVERSKAPQLTVYMNESSK